MYVYDIMCCDENVIQKVCKNRDLKHREGNEHNLNYFTLIKTRKITHMVRMNMLEHKTHFGLKLLKIHN